MNYLMYAEVLEGAWFKISDNLQELKDTWQNGGKRIWEVGDLTQEQFNTWEKPRFPKVVGAGFKLIFADRELMWEKDPFGGGLDLTTKSEVSG